MTIVYESYPKVFANRSCQDFGSTNWYIGLVGRVFANTSGDFSPIPGRIIPKTLKMVLDTSLLNTRQYKVHIKSGAIQGKE